MALTKEEILAEIQKYVAANKKAPGEHQFAEASGIKESVWKGKIWIRWTDAVREAGYTPQIMKQKIPDEDLLRNLADFATRLGRFPVRDEINLEARRTLGFPVWQTFQKRYGGMPETAAALLDYSRKTGNATLSAICEDRLAKEAAKPVAGSRSISQPPRAKLGFVYLKYSPSLRLFKIGKAANADRRGARISLLLPEDLVPKHEIKTDCPYILEKYWHERFRAKRRQGEWFELSAADVEAFKRRGVFVFSEFFP
jgi:hypothetical protein